MDFLDHTLEDFREYLKENTESKNTVKNYVSDLRIFLIFLDSRHAPITAENFPRFLSNDTLQEFSNYLSVINPPATLNRRVSSVKKFFDYYLEHHPLPVNTPTENLPPEILTPPAIENEVLDQEPITEMVSEPETITNDSVEDVSQDRLPEESESSLLRLLPEEISEPEPEQKDEHRPGESPSSFLKVYKVQIICTVSFILGFLSTMVVYPLLYP